MNILQILILFHEYTDVLIIINQASNNINILYQFS